MICTEPKGMEPMAYINSSSGELPQKTTRVRRLRGRSAYLYRSGLTDNQVDAATLGKILEIQNLNDSDRKHIMTTVDALLRDAKVRNAHK